MCRELAEAIKEYEALLPEYKAAEKKARAKLGAKLGKILSTISVLEGEMKVKEKDCYVVHADVPSELRAEFTFL
jgi:hypothetical protein